MTPIRLRSLAGLALVSTVLLTGCGTTPAFNPGVAARVDDQTISVRTVDDVTGTFCDAAGAQEDGTVFPQSYVRGYIAGTLTLRSAAEQFGDEYGVTAGAGYAEAVKQTEAGISSVPEDEKQGVIDVQTSAIYVTEIKQAAGAAILEEQGDEVTDEDATAAGEEAFLAWLDDNDVRIDPKFGVAIEDGLAAPSDTSLSYAVSDTATKGSSSWTSAAGAPGRSRSGATPSLTRRRSSIRRSEIASSAPRSSSRSARAATSDRTTAVASSKPSGTATATPGSA